MCIKWIINHFIGAGKFTVDILNQRIHRFRYGVIEYRNKPSPNFTTLMIQKQSNSIKQKSIQTWLLLHAAFSNWSLNSS